MLCCLRNKSQRSGNYELLINRINDAEQEFCPTRPGLPVGGNQGVNRKDNFCEDVTGGAERNLHS
jgi:hypothetical protein